MEISGRTVRQQNLVGLKAQARTHNLLSSIFDGLERSSKWIAGASVFVAPVIFGPEAMILAFPALLGITVGQSKAGEHAIKAYFLENEVLKLEEGYIGPPNYQPAG